MINLQKFRLFRLGNYLLSLMIICFMLSSEVLGCDDDGTCKHSYTIDSSNGGTYDDFYNLVTDLGSINIQTTITFTESVTYDVDKMIDINADYLENEAKVLQVIFQANKGVTVTFNVQPNVALFFVSSGELVINSDDDYGDFIFSGSTSTNEDEATKEAIIPSCTQMAFVYQFEDCQMTMNGGTIENFINPIWSGKELDDDPDFVGVCAAITLQNAFQQEANTVKISGSANLKGVTFNGNQGVVASAVAVGQGATLTISDSTIENSSVSTSDISSTTDGFTDVSGQIWNQGSLTASQVTFSGNTGDNEGCASSTGCTLNDNDDTEADADTEGDDDANMNQNSSTSSTVRKVLEIGCPILAVVAIAVAAVIYRRQRKTENKSLKVQLSDPNKTPYDQF